MFKNPLKADVTVKHVIELPDTEVLKPVITEIKRITRKTLVVLAIGIPAVMVLGYALHTASEIAINSLDNPVE